MNVFHQFGALYITPDDKQAITPEDLKNALSEIGKSVFGDINFRFYEHNFPYTDPSFEMEAEINSQWVEMVGSGMARKSVLANFGLSGYHGWAFGFGLDRLAIASMSLPDIRLLWSDDPRVKKQLKLGQKFVEVSKYPPIVRDISFIVNKDFVPIITLTLFAKSARIWWKKSVCSTSMKTKNSAPIKLATPTA